MTSNQLTELIVYFEQSKAVRWFLPKPVVRSVLDALKELDERKYAERGIVLSALNTRVRNSLEKIGKTMNDARHMTNDELIAIEGIGPKGLALVRGWLVQE